MENIDVNVLLSGLVLFVVGIASLVYTFKKRSQILSDAESKAKNILLVAKTRDEQMLQEAKESVKPFEERIERLKLSDKEIVTRLRQSRKLIDNVTDLCSLKAGEIELITEEDLLSSQAYQEDRKEVRSKLKKLACNAMLGVTGSNSDVNMGKFVAISAKADMAGALLLTTIEMLCAKTNASNGHQSLEKLFESIIATEALVKCMDSRAFINPGFKDLLEKRLQIEINFKKAKQIAREEQRELREQEREERKARQEAEKVQREAEKEEAIKRQAIAEIQAKMARENESERAKHQSELEKLELELADAHSRLERAKSRAQETKQGHVYVVSNIGSFGDSVLKIGMTRRLEPMDRIKELGDASVPFSFDVHALIESDDAPGLENKLHEVFDNKRVNKVNRRKEYFNVKIEEIEERLSALGVNALINRVASADEYYQSIKLGSKVDQKHEQLEVENT